MKKRLYLNCACLLFFVTYFSQSYAAIVVGGSYNTTGSEFRPLIAESFNSGKDWSFPTSITQTSSLSPSFAKNGRFSQTICKDTTCMAVGSYEDVTGLTSPLIGISNNGGKDWSYPQINASLRKLADYGSAGLFAVACRSSQVCIAVGNYTPKLPKAKQALALIAITKNGGKNWVFKTLTKPAQLIRVFNYKNTWFVSGTSILDKVSSSIGSGLYRSVNDGGTWNLVSPTVINPTAVIADLKCSGKNCLAVGAKVTLTLKSGNVTDVKYTPFIATSINLGANWSVPKIISSAKIQGLLLSISCSATNCMTVGVSGNPLAGSIVRPLTYVTRNSGKGWYMSNIFAKAPPTINTLAFAGMTGVACNNAVCFSTGVALKLSLLKEQFQLIPFLVVSKDWGMTWTYDKSIALRNTNGYIFNPSFNGNIGVVLGGKLNTNVIKNLNLSKQKPFIGISSNNGASWTYPTQIQNPMLSPTYSSFNGFDLISEFSSN